MKTIYTLSQALLVIIFIGCASQSAPTGGPKDETPPCNGRRSRERHSRCLAPRVRPPRLHRAQSQCRTPESPGSETDAPVQSATAA